MVLVDQYDTSSLTGDGVFHGAWGCHPYTPAGRVYISDTIEGLFVFSVEGVTVSVFISAFDAELTDDGVRLSWAIASADGLEGFHIYRSTGSGFVRLREAMLGVERIDYVDDTVEPGRAYRYRLGAVDRDGEFFSQIVNVTTPKGTLGLAQNHPNPFNPTTAIDYEVPRAGHVQLVIYDAAGRAVRTLVDATRSSGPHRVSWDGRDDGGIAVSSGVYFYRLQSTGRVLSRRMVLLR
jgi:hypothetical protein